MEEINVKTTVPRTLHESLRRVANEERRPMKAIIREAIEAYLRKRARLDDDPIRQFVGAGTLEGTDRSERKDWRG